MFKWEIHIKKSFNVLKKNPWLSQTLIILQIKELNGMLLALSLT